MPSLQKKESAVAGLAARPISPPKEVALPDLARLQAAIGLVFKDPSLLEQALVHRSYANEAGLSSVSNERLEFLGDAAVGFVVAHKLYHDYPDLLEGDLTKIRAALVSNESLARLGASLNLGDYLYLGRGEEASGGRRRETTLARALEALAGAILLDQGMEPLAELLRRGLDWEAAYTEGIESDSKSQLQELSQSHHLGTPHYRTVRTQGPDHRKEFTVEVLIADKVLGKGKGRSKQAAQKEAANEALARWQADPTLAASLSP
ncbi:MAG: ribonuclease III [Chloroflexi bacterium]|nr:ribonuclease III [Chloroflexota bacterium]